MLCHSAALRHAARLGLRRAPTLASPAAPAQLRRATGGLPAPLLNVWYRAFGHSSIGYATWLVAGILVCEGLTGALGDGVWNSVNAGRTYETVDWTKFKTDDDDDEDDEDEDDEEDEEGDEEEGGDDEGGEDEDDDDDDDE